MAETSYNGSPRKKKKKKKKNNNNNSNKMSYDDWDKYFMSVAALFMKYTNCSRQVGACIVDNNKKIISCGYNEMSRGCSEFCWNKNSRRGFYVCHAELNAIIDAMITSIDLNKCTIYVTLFPCNECAKLIIRSGIKTVIYASAKLETQTEAARRMFNAADVTIRQYKPKGS
ncbi:Deoxycytidylate deaminase [Ooceraea biroi]|uniref:dCMP deaminase n=1 Tax=Ooceraea biroi TaxID=2015173 RepID=A0A026VTM8_OOCBI|nr:Deoxycytidylate deaminase [Ooceraea biroi]